MNKKNLFTLLCVRNKVRRCFLTAGWVSLMCLAGILPVSASAFAQQEKLTFQSSELTVKEVLDVITAQLQYDVFYNTELLNVDRKVKFQEKEMQIDQVLNCILGNKFSYSLEGKTIVITPVKEVAQQVDKIVIKGEVKDNSGQVLPGVTVLVKGTQLGTATDAKGCFELSLPKMENLTLLFSFIGMESKEVVVGDPSKLVKVVLKESAETLKEVVATGIYTRKKESFTGSASTYTAEDLKTMGTQNILQSLKTLDPAFAIIDDNLYGSDPNHLPNMEIRGKSSMLGLRDELEADPNQPLFILDGFESTLQAISDLDINRVASITILKDAASTAIYGSKAANGVVVVETVKPQAGKLMVSYNGNANFTIPDLSSYNLMNSREKLEFERLTGRYSSGDKLENVKLQEQYFAKLKEIEGGLDTYWLADPLRVGVNHKHSLYVQGGEGSFLFGLGAGYNGNSGVMKDSKREIVSGNLDLIYRVSKFQFSNKMSFNLTKMENPVVPFSDYANANPYYKKQNDDGSIEKWLEKRDRPQRIRAANPLWNASQNSRDEGKSLTFQNYFVAEYMPTAAFKARARFGITYTKDDTEKFISREDTRYDDIKDETKKGEYTSTTTDQTQYEGELTLTYAKVFGKHQVNLVAGGNLFGSTALTQGYSVQGFPVGDFTYPSFANGYPEYGAPTFYEVVSRSVNFYFNGGYSFDNRYQLDVSLRENGSSVFGSSRRFTGTWSVGLGWNLHNEAFIKNNIAWIDFLKIRGSIGNPGNQGFESSKTLTTFNFQYGSSNYFGMGAALAQLGNPDLDWQITLDKNVGVDITLLNKRLTATLDYYHKVTDPLLISVNMPLSSGVTTYATNAGKQISQGLTASLSYYIIQNLDKRLSWLIRGNLRTQKTELDEIGNKLSSLNKYGKGRNTMRYYDGADPDDLWAVKSAGIDPSTGRELFYDKNGNYTYDYSYDNEVICGNSRPDIEGILGTSFAYKGFSFSLNFRYQVGAHIFNEALFNKVENITDYEIVYNQDKRALYERWQKPGDIRKFKNIADASSTPMSSRFIQKENALALESIYVGYEFLDGWIRKAGLSSLKVQASMRDVFRASTIKSERGTLYPFARTVELGLSLNF